MHRLNGEDAGFLYMDVPGQPMNSMAVGVLSREHATLTLADVRAHIESRLDELPSWRWRIVRVPRDLHHPVAVRDPRFDLDAHVREVTVTGGERELDAWFASLAEEHLATDRPLWQVWLVTGLDDGCQALVVKYHHALADGSGAVTTFSRVFSDLVFEPLPPLPGHTGEPCVPERIPSGPSLVIAALWAHLIAFFLVIPGLLLRTRRQVKAVRRERDANDVELPPYAGGAPRTSLNTAFTAPRSYVRAALPLADLKQVKEGAGVTLNDVVLGVVAGACVRYLATRDGVPARPLLTTVPMAADPAGSPTRQFGNHFWSFTTSLATDISDPWERLQQISAVSGAGKRQLEALGVGLVPAWLDVTPPALAHRAIQGAITRLQDPATDVDASILVSNVRGPSKPWSLGGRVFSQVHVDGPPSNGVGCNVMVWTYADMMNVGVLAYADAMDDPAQFKAALEASCAELVSAAQSRRGLRAAG